MKWQEAVKLAGLCDDLEYDEWCSLFVSKFYPTYAQEALARECALKVLIRNGLVSEDLVLF
jgi:hypothetical protein